MKLNLIVIVSILVGTFLTAGFASAQCPPGFKLDVGLDETRRVFAAVSNDSAFPVEVKRLTVRATNAHGGVVTQIERELRVPKFIRPGRAKWVLVSPVILGAATIARFESFLFDSNGVVVAIDSYPTHVKISIDFRIDELLGTCVTFTNTTGSDIAAKVKITRYKADGTKETGEHDQNIDANADPFVVYYPGVEPAIGEKVGVTVEDSTDGQALGKGSRKRE